MKEMEGVFLFFRASFGRGLRISESKWGDAYTCMYVERHGTPPGRSGAPSNIHGESSINRCGLVLVSLIRPFFPTGFAAGCLPTHTRGEIQTYTAIPGRDTLEAVKSGRHGNCGASLLLASLLTGGSVPFPAAPLERAPTRRPHDTRSFGLNTLFFPHYPESNHARMHGPQTKPHPPPPSSETELTHDTHTHMYTHIALLQPRYFRGRDPHQGAP